MTRRILAMVMALCMVLTFVPVSAAAATQAEETVPAATEETAGAAFDIEQMLKEGELEGTIAREPVYAPTDSGYYTDVEDAIARLRSQMVSRKRTVQIPLRVSKAEIPGEEEMVGLIVGIFALATAHTGVGNEGDYLLLGLEDFDYGGTYSETDTYYYLNISYSFDYITSSSMEDAVLREINKFFSSVNFTAETDDFTKALAIYDFICYRVKYAEETTPGHSNEFYKYTAYGALCSSGAVGLGYATLVYRLMLMAGVDCRVILSADGEHAWNIVKIDGAWYNLDSMLDAGYLEYWYFLRGSENFTDHVREATYDSADFHTLYPMSATDYVPADPTVITSGSCGADLTYTIYSDGYLEITGTGPMDNWTSAQEAPWSNYRGYVRFVSVGDGVTSVGSYAFAECVYLQLIDLPNSIAEIGHNAFRDANFRYFVVPTGLRKIGAHAFYSVGHTEAFVIQDLTGWLAVEIENEYAHPASGTWYLGEEELTTLVIPEGITAIKDYAFYGADITSLHIPDSVTSIGNYAFAYTYELTQVTGCNNVSSIGDSAFVYAEMTELTFNSIERIGANAFNNCNNVQKLTLGPGLTSVGDRAFSMTRAPMDLYISDLAAWCNIDFEYIPLTYYMSSVLSNPLWRTENLYCNGELVTDLVIPDGVTEIKNYAFAGYRSLTSVTVPETVTSIGKVVFFECANLDSVHFLGDAPAFQSDSFASSSFTAYYPAGNPTWTENVRQNYGGRVTWVGVCPDGHTVTEYVSNNDATVDADGTKTGTCSVCGAKDTIVDEGSRLVSMAVTTPPVKQIYLLNEPAADLTGAVATVTCEDGRTFTVDVTDEMFAAMDISAVGTGTVTIRHLGLEATFEVQVTKATVIFRNADGTELSRAQYGYGETVAVPEDPALPNGIDPEYIFRSWDKPIATCTGDAVYTAVFGPAVLLGDVNMDGFVDSMDTNILFRYANEDPTLGELTALQLAAGDANGDGFVDSMDTNILFRYANEDPTLEWRPV